MSNYQIFKAMYPAYEITKYVKQWKYVILYYIYNIFIIDHYTGAIQEYWLLLYVERLILNEPVCIFYLLIMKCLST